MLLQLADKQKKPESDPNEGNDEEQRAHIAVAVYGICVWQFFFLGSGILWTVMWLLRGMFRFSSRKVSIMKFRNWHSHLAIYSELKNTITMWWDIFILGAAAYPEWDKSKLFLPYSNARLLT